MSHDWLSAALASDAADGMGVLPLWVRPLRDDMRIVGQVSTAKVTTDDNLDLRHAVERGPEPGTVLVVGGGAESRHACMGGLLAMELRLRGFDALITDGLVRDAAEIRAAGVRVWCRGRSPVAPSKRGGGQVGGEVRIGEVVVRPGDYVIADEDGIVIWPQERYAELLDRAQARLLADQQRERDLGAQLAAQGGEHDASFQEDMQMHARDGEQ